MRAPGRGVYEYGGAPVKVLVMYDYPPSPGGLATQGALLARGLREIGVDVHEVNFQAPVEKEWYYRVGSSRMWLSESDSGPYPPTGIASFAIRSPAPSVAGGRRIHCRPPRSAQQPGSDTHDEQLGADTYIRDGIRGDIIDVLRSAAIPTASRRSTGTIRKSSPSVKPMVFLRIRS